MRYLGSIGYNERTLRTYQSSINIISRLLFQRFGSIPLDRITAEQVQNVLDGTDLKERTKKKHAVDFGRFIAYETGRNPVDPIYQPKSIPVTVDGHLVYEFPFPEESQAFGNHLASIGYYPKDIDNAVSVFEIAIRLLLREKGYFKIEQITPDFYSALVPLTEYMVRQYRTKTLRTFGIYCMYRFGCNPYEDIDTREPKEGKYYPYAEEIEQYRRWMEKEGFRGIDERIASLRSAARRFGRSVNEKPLSEITEEDMRRYRKEMYMDLRSSTAKHQFLMMKNLIIFSTGKDICRGYTFRFGRNVPMRQYLSKEDFKKLWNTANPQERLVLALGGAMGLRRTEMVGILMDDIRTDTITVRGKGHGKYGLVKEMSMPKSVKNALSEYLKERESILWIYGDDSKGHLLIRRRIRPGTPMDQSSMNELIHGLSERTQIPFSAHSLRRFFATLLYESGLTEEAIAEQMRHASFSTTSDCYLNPTECTVEEAMRRVTEELHGGIE